MRFIRRKLTFSNAVALLALFVALGGSAYAFHLGKNAVKTKNIKNGAVTEAKLAGGAVTASKLAPGAVGSANLGDVVVRSTTVSLPDPAGPIATAHCNAGEKLLGATARVGAGGSGDVAVEGMYPVHADGNVVKNGESTGTGAGMSAQFHNFFGSTGETFGEVFAFCLK
jgi:hypothetical protein